MLKIVATRGDHEFLPDVPVEALPELLRDPRSHVWVDASGAEEPQAEALARELFAFHPMAISDCFGRREHPKVEAFEDYLFLITHGMAAESTAENVQIVELDSFLGKNYLFTYHEQPSRGVTAAVELVARNRGGPLRRGPAGVLHAILDNQIDNMEPVLDDLEERVQVVEEKLVERSLAQVESEGLVSLLALKRTTLGLRRWMTKQREVVLRLARNEFALVPQYEAVLFRDLYDHLNRYTDLLETHREMITSLQETYLSLSNLRLGETMKFLTVFTAVLMPLTVITGVYGMNFQFMPELGRHWGYPAALVLMVAVAGSMVLFFRRKGWIGKPKVPPEKS
jgi:magnesium transporter